MLDRLSRRAYAALGSRYPVAVVGVGLGQVVGSSAGEDSLMAESDTAASDDSAESADRSEGRASGEDLDATGGGEIDDQLDEGLDEELAAGAEMLSDGAVSEFSALEDLVVLRGRLADVREERFTRAATRIQRLVIGGDAEVAPQDTTSLRRAAPRVQRAWQGCAPADWGPGTPVAVLYERSPAVLVFRPATGDAQVADLVQCGTGEVLRSLNAMGLPVGHQFVYVWALPLHRGEVFGLPQRILWLMVVLIGAGLPLTGMWLWYTRRSRVRDKRES